ncbi:amphi-Trp domain-containing protein [Streptomyces sp. CS081A]|uniref:amphi-Trp domain-containing protein n=1 Tax=Streptomyces sp. CS081A TaxID=2162709 RepID=UPI000D51B940|nr:amphi-Trp domain-containing protein [Streptomyces sp. CS081A]PVC66284.1 amphi-Trp domain-containing protein [Streptomyces sp. CS081A]
MKDLKFEQKRSVSRLEAAEQLMALATALKEGGDVEWDIGHGRLSLHVPDEVRTEIEVETGEGEVELEIELKWPVAGPRPKPRTRPRAEGEEEAEQGGDAPPEPKPKRSGAATRRRTSAKRSVGSS